MDEKQQKGVASELIAEYYLTKAGYFVYTKKSVQSAVDLVAINPETGEVLACKGSLERTHTTIYTGRTAKELGIKITEVADPCPISKLDHALYLGREFVRAEIALLSGAEYIQD